MALAAAGVLAAAGRSIHSRNLGEALAQLMKAAEGRPLRWEAPAPISPENVAGLAAAWRQAIESEDKAPFGKRLIMDVESIIGNADARTASDRIQNVAKAITLPARSRNEPRKPEDIAAVSFAVARYGRSHPWQWPLRVAFADNIGPALGHELRSIRAAQRGHVTFVTDRDAGDVLFSARGGAGHGPRGVSPGLEIVLGAGPTGMPTALAEAPARHIRWRSSPSAKADPLNACRFDARMT